MPPSLFTTPSIAVSASCCDFPMNVPGPEIGMITLRFTGSPAATAVPTAPSVMASAAALAVSAL
jgi:hypothetical protein